MQCQARQVAVEAVDDLASARVRARLLAQAPAPWQLQSLTVGSCIRARVGLASTVSQWRGGQPIPPQLTANSATGSCT